VTLHPEQKLRQALRQREKRGQLRTLSRQAAGVDFCSNDYLGLSRSAELHSRIRQLREQHGTLPLGSTGSRLISGNTGLAEELERQLAEYHRAEAALLYSSGYAANSGLFAAVAGMGDTLIMDELIHASSVDGARLSRAGKRIFRHNDTDDLAEQLAAARAASPDGAILVGVESLYSMDGDFAPLREMAAMCAEYTAGLIVDEAHTHAVSGPGGAGRVVEQGLETGVFARIHTFGKGLGLHGAAVLGSPTLREYLVNFSRPFVFSTAAPADSLLHIQAAHELLPDLDGQRQRLLSLVDHFRRNTTRSSHHWLESQSWIQSLLIPGNDAATALADRLHEQGYLTKAIRAPSVAAGSERLRICLHTFNSHEEIDGLFAALENPACKAVLSQA